MKFIIAFTLVAACVAASCSAAAVHAPDYAAVGRKVAGIRTIVSAGICQVKTIANSDNAAVGSAIESQLDAAAAAATSIFEEAQAGIVAQNLTEAKARELFGNLKNILAGVQADIQDELAELSAGAASQIRDIFYDSYDTVERTAQEIYALLSSKASTFAPDYPAVGRKVEEVRGLVSTALSQIKTIASNDNAAVGSAIGSQLDAAAAKASAVLQQAQSAIDAQTLTVSQAESLFGQLKDILAGVQGDLQDELAQLSTGAAGQIRDIFYASYAKAEAIAQEVYALLA